MCNVSTNLVPLHWTPSIADLRAAIHMNAITNSPVMAADVYLAEKIFGPDIATIKGKAIRQNLCQ